MFLVALCVPSCLSTETGNPPNADVMAVHWEQLQGVVLFAGDKGAVKPGGSVVEIANERTREATRMKSKRDGSFQLHVAGSLDDGFTLTAIHEGQRSDPLTLVEPGAHATMCGDGGADGGSCTTTRQRVLTDCGAAYERASQQLEAALTTAAQGCSSAADCIFVSTETQCRKPCQTEPISSAAQSSFALALQQIDEQICAPVRPPCAQIVEGCAAAPEVAECVDGRCQRRQF